MRRSNTRNKHFDKSTGLFFGILALLGLAACQSEKSQPHSDDSLLVYCSEGSPDSFNPQLVTSGTSLDATTNTVYSRLVEYQHANNIVIPSLAKSWQVSDDGLRYHFELRQGVAFHSNQHFVPSRFLNADDVIFSFKRQSDKTQPYHYISGGHYPYYYSQSLDKLIVEINKLSDYEVEFVLSRPESPFISMLTSPFASILSAEYADKMLAKQSPELVDQAPIGTGPFRFVKYQVDSFIRYRAFKQYFASNPQVKNLVYAITPDAAMRFSRFSAGECDLMSYPLPVHLKVAQQQSSFQSLQVAGLNVAYWAFNVQKPPFDDVRVRRALNMAINRSAILKTVYDQQATLATSPLPPTSWAFEQELEPTIYNFKQAQKELADAGYPEGFEIEIWAMPVQRAYNPNARKMAEMMQQDLKKIGVRAKIISFEWGTFLSKVRHGEHHSVLLGWSADNGDPNNFLTPLLSCTSAVNGPNYSRWCDRTFDKLLLSARQTTQPELRKALYQQAQNLFKQQAPWLTLAHANRSLLAQERIKGAKVTAFGSISFDQIHFAPESVSSAQEQPQKTQELAPAKSIVAQGKEL